MYSFTKNEKEFQINKINAEYNQQVREIMNMRFERFKKN
jgi:hypothetical protein